MSLVSCCFGLGELDRPVLRQLLEYTSKSNQHNSGLMNPEDIMLAVVALNCIQLTTWVYSWYGGGLSHTHRTGAYDLGYNDRRPIIEYILSENFPYYLRGEIFDIIRGAVHAQQDDSINFLLDHPDLERDRPLLLHVAMVESATYDRLSDVIRYDELFHQYGQEALEVSDENAIWLLDDEQKIARRWALSMASREGYRGIVDYIYGQSSETERKIHQYSGLTGASRTAQLGMVKHLIDLGADNWDRALEEVCFGIRRGGHSPIGSYPSIDWSSREMQNRVQIVELLLAKGANPKIALGYFLVTDRGSPIHQLLLNEVSDDLC